MRSAHELITFEILGNKGLRYNCLTNCHSCEQLNLGLTRNVLPELFYNNPQSARNLVLGKSIILTILLLCVPVTFLQMSTEFSSKSFWCVYFFAMS